MGFLNKYNSKENEMKYHLIRDDEKEDEVTSQYFENYEDAYDFLEHVYGNICCSDADYEDRPYYEIIARND